MIRRLLGWCRHAQVSWPVGGYQRCLACGQKRHYQNRDGTLGTPGPWVRDLALRAERK